MDKHQIGTKVATRLLATEAAIDAAMVQTSQLLESLVTGRREMHIADACLDVAEARVAEAIAALAQARRTALAAHSALGKFERLHDIQHTAIGIMPKHDLPPSAVGDLQIAG